MNANAPLPPLTPDDPRLTALALGEISDPAERAALEKQVADDPALRAALDSARRLTDGLRESLAAEPLPFVNPAAIAAKAMGGAPAATRRRTSALGGSISAPRATTDGDARSRLVTFCGLGAAAAACLAVFVATRSPHEAREATDALVAAGAPAAPAPLVVLPSASRNDLGYLAKLLPGLPGAGAAFRPAGRAPLSLSASGARAYAAAFSRELVAGRRPAPSRTRVDGLVNAFIAGHRSPAGARPVQIEAALTDAPWNPANRLLRVTVRAHGATGEIVARNASASVDFDAAGVKSWRLLGHNGATAPTSGVALRAGESVTTLYEIEPGADSTDAPLGRVTVRYARADKSGADLAEVKLNASQRASLADTDADTRFAAGLAAYALNPGENTAAALAVAAGSDPERRAFAACAR